MPFEILQQINETANENLELIKKIEQFSLNLFNENDIPSPEEVKQIIEEAPLLEIEDFGMSAAAGRAQERDWVNSLQSDEANRKGGVFRRGLGIEYGEGDPKLDDMVLLGKQGVGKIVDQEPQKGRPKKIMIQFRNGQTRIFDRTQLISPKKIQGGQKTAWMIGRGF